MKLIISTTFIVKILDADKGDRLESSTGRVASRDIVQFVPLRDVQSKSVISQDSLVEVLLIISKAGSNICFAGGEISVVQALLAELPSQFLTYMRTRDIKPNVWSLKYCTYEN